MASSCIVIQSFRLATDFFDLMAASDRPLCLALQEQSLSPVYLYKMDAKLPMASGFVPYFKSAQN